MNPDTPISSSFSHTFTRRIIFIGFMGAGKSYLGIQIAALMKLPFYDTDLEVEKRENLSISEIFRFRGEDSFRIIERDILLKAAPVSVIATGGGIIELPENREFLKKNKDVVIWLNPEWKIVFQRIKQTGRPKVEKLNEKELYALWLKRIPLYAECASFTYQGDSLSELLLMIKK